MRWTVQLGQVVIGSWSRIGVTDEHRKRSAGGRPIGNAGKDFDGVSFVSLRCEPTLSGPATIKLGLNVIEVDGEFGWKSVDDDADASAMAFAKG